MMKRERVGQLSSWTLSSSFAISPDGKTLATAIAYHRFCVGVPVVDIAKASMQAISQAYKEFQE